MSTNYITRQVSMTLANTEPMYVKCCNIANMNKYLSESYEDWCENTARDMETYFEGEVELVRDEPARTIIEIAMREIDWDSIAEDFCDEDEWEPEVEYTGEFDDDHDDILETDAS